MGAVVLLALATPSVFAQGWNGQQPGTISGLGGLTLSGDTFTWTRNSASANAKLSIQGGVQNGSLLAIRGLWIVDQGGNTISGFTTTSTGGYLLDSSNAKTYWNADSDPAGYYSKDNGFGNNKAWLALVSDSTLQSYSKPANDFTQGSFKIQGLSNWINLSNNHTFNIGIDYMVGTTGGAVQTGRVYFAAPSSFYPTQAVPESGTGILAGISLVSLLGICSRRLQRAI